MIGVYRNFGIERSEAILAAMLIADKGGVSEIRPFLVEVSCTHGVRSQHWSTQLPLRASAVAVVLLAVHQSQTDVVSLELQLRVGRHRL